MMGAEKTCRQSFATITYFNKYASHLEERIKVTLESIANPLVSDYDRAILSLCLCTDFYESISVAYSYGHSLEKITSQLDALVGAYEKERGLSIISYGSDEVLAGFGENDEYEQFLQTLSLCILLGRSDLIPRLTAIFDRDNKGQDIIYESLLSFYDNDRIKIDGLFFKKPYASLLKVIRAETPEQASKLLAKYCKDWYPAFKKAPWHDSHLSIIDDEGTCYTGYWAFEAGAVAFLYGIDDSQIDHLVYPKDMVAYAREHVKKSNGLTRVPAGEPCPKAGYWFTPAQANSRRLFKQGEIMPAFEGSHWSATLWYWSEEDKL